MKMLCPERLDAAVIFMQENARPLERELFRLEQSKGSAEDVLRELAAYQNDDGGYGHGLEPDARSALSSVLDTTCALQVLRRLKTAPDHPQVQQALEYLESAFDSELGLWPIRPMMPAGTPAAPWWTYRDSEHWAEKVAEGALNPTAEALGYWIEFGGDAQPPFIEQAESTVRAYLGQHRNALEMHDLMCVARLARTPGLEPEWAAELMERVARETATQVPTDPAQWTAYGLRPWGVAEAPGDPALAELPSGLLDAMLDHDIDGQGTDGAWAPSWDWHGLHTDEWPHAARAAKGLLTEQMLRVLRNFGRIEA
ncbi:hypothetical protein [Algisphaera agarilytica]|uniref:Uncharacterized protein n=1 Tax=Algisphaera agarilytica TaxID=1385975 RepID=A0A7X0LIW3_9BACT|nr:hypothetical protein [Algisphaera agarilytica]MBB6428670.1 hypothetical protein [Algisphaera agarilytica]